MTKRDIAHVPRATSRFPDALFRSYHNGYRGDEENQGILH